DGVTDHALLVREELVETEEVESVGAHRRPLYTGHRAGGKLRSREAPEPAVRPGGRRAFVRQLPPRTRAARAADAPVHPARARRAAVHHRAPGVRAVVPRGPVRARDRPYVAHRRGDAPAASPAGAG